MPVDYKLSGVRSDHVMEIFITTANNVNTPSLSFNCQNVRQSLWNNMLGSITQYSSMQKLSLQKRCRQLHLLMKSHWQKVTICTSSTGDRYHTNVITHEYQILLTKKSLSSLIYSVPKIMTISVSDGLLASLYQWESSGLIIDTTLYSDI